MDPSQSNVSGPDWVAAQAPREPIQGLRQEPAPPRVSQGYGAAALAVGCALMLMSVLAHMLAVIYSGMARQILDPLSSRLALAGSIAGVILVLGLNVAIIIVGGLGLRESGRLGAGRGIAALGMAVAIVSFVLWLIAASVLLVNMIDALR
jgi:hypothetical protein